MDYKPNSNRFKAEQKEAAKKEKVEKVITGTAKIKKKNEISKLADVFISEDARNVKSYVLMDVLVPTIKKAIVDIVTDGINMIFFGGTARGKSGGNSHYVSYGSKYSGNYDRFASDNTTRSGQSLNTNVIVDTRGEAEDVLMRMGELIELYGEASVADLHDLVGVTGNYTDHSYGWTNVRNARVVRVREGFLLDMPKVIPLKR